MLKCQNVALYPIEDEGDELGYIIIQPQGRGKMEEVDEVVVGDAID